MTPDASFFKELDQSHISKVIINNGESVDVKGKRVVVVDTPSSTKYISYVFFVPDLSQSLFNVRQMLERNYALHFKNMKCTIFDPYGCQLMSVKMIEKIFPLD